MRLRDLEVRYKELESKLKDGINAFCPNCGFRMNVVPKNTGKISGALGGIISGAYMGSSIGLAGGPLGAIAGTIPGAILGGIFGKSMGNNFDNPRCYKCETKFKIPNKLISDYNILSEEFEKLANDPWNRYGKNHKY